MILPGLIRLALNAWLAGVLYDKTVKTRYYMLKFPAGQPAAWHSTFPVSAVGVLQRQKQDAEKDH
jgi:hypothetical protein